MLQHEFRQPSRDHQAMVRITITAIIPKKRVPFRIFINYIETSREEHNIYIVYHILLIFVL